MENIANGLRPMGEAKRPRGEVSVEHSGVLIGSDGYNFLALSNSYASGDCSITWNTLPWRHDRLSKGTRPHWDGKRAMLPL
jgi:hypothetical protein